jgi:hypothetical protein
LICFYFIAFSKSYTNYITTLRLHVLFEYVLITSFLYFSFINNKVKYLLITLLPIFILYYIYDYFKNGNSTFGNIPTIIEFLIFIFFIIIFFYESIQENFQIVLYKKINFWLCVGFLFYTSGNFFYILLVEKFFNAQLSVKNQLILIYSIVTIIKNIIFSLSFLVKETPQITNNSISYAPDLDLEPTRTNTN